MLTLNVRIPDTRHLWSRDSLLEMFYYKHVAPLEPRFTIGDVLLQTRGSSGADRPSVAIVKASVGSDNGDLNFTV